MTDRTSVPSPVPVGPRANPDPVDSAVGSLASSRWTHEPDWPTFKEKLMNPVRTRFEFARRRPFLFATLAVATLGGTVAAGTYAYNNIFHVSGELRLDDGTNVPFEGEVVTDGDTSQVSIEINGSATSAGQTELTLPDGRKVQVIAQPAGAQTEKKQETPAPSNPK